MNTQESSEDWFAFAEMDRRSARILFDCDADNEMACLHACRAAVEVLSGYLAKEGGVPAGSFQLSRLLDLALIQNTEFRHVQQEVTLLTAFESLAWKPGGGFEPVTDSTVKKSLDAMENLFTFVQNRIG